MTSWSEDKRLAYIAGLFDGEGSVMLITNKPKSGYSHRTYYPSLSLANSHFDVLNMVMDTLKVGSISNKSGNVNYRVKNWQCFGATNIILVAHKLIPYTIIKKEELELLFAYCHKQASISAKARAFSRHDREKYKYYMSLYEETAQETLVKIKESREGCRVRI